MDWFSFKSNFSLEHTPGGACIKRKNYQTVWPLRTAMSWQLMGVDGVGMKSIPDILLCTSLTFLCPGREEIWEEDQLDATLSTDLASVLFTQCGRTEFWLIPRLSESGKLTGSTWCWDCKMTLQNCDYDRGAKTPNFLRKKNSGRSVRNRCSRQTLKAHVCISQHCQKMRIQCSWNII